MQDPKSMRIELEAYVNFQFEMENMEQSCLINSVKEENVEDLMKWEKNHRTSNPNDNKQNIGAKKTIKRVSQVDHHKIKLLEQSMKKNFSNTHKTKILKI